MIRYHKSQINEHQLILILHSLCKLYFPPKPQVSPQTVWVYPCKALISPGYIWTSLILSLFSDCGQRERRDLRAEWSVACDGGSPGSQCGPRVPKWSPASADGQQHRGRSVSQCWTVTECRAPDNRAATDTIHSGAQARNVINTTHGVPPCHMWVWSYTLLVWSSG